MTTASEILLYHYTAKQNLDAIIQSGIVNLSGKKPFQPRAISLTSDTSSEGHGLPDGRMISQMEAAQIQHYATKNGELRCFDHTECRLTLCLSTEDTCLIKATDYHEADQLFALDIAAWNPTHASISDFLLLTTVQKIQQRLLPLKSGTWWYYTTPIPLSQVSLIEVRDASGAYIQVAP